jgi:hypothetical protein
MLRMHDHLKYPYFVAFYENRVKVGLRTIKTSFTFARVKLTRFHYGTKAKRMLLPQQLARDRLTRHGLTN